MRKSDLDEELRTTMLTTMMTMIKMKDEKTNQGE